ncbi:MAG: hypothetical protein RML12_10460 [Xanthomonadales bacterium]|nr:hypothetical protein [Xanthomonadales bacterium]
MSIRGSAAPAAAEPRAARRHRLGRARSRARDRGPRARRRRASSFPAVPLKPGWNRILLTLRDAEGRVATALLRVRRALATPAIRELETDPRTLPRHATWRARFAVDTVARFPFLDFDPSAPAGAEGSEGVRVEARITLPDGRHPRPARLPPRRGRRARRRTVRHRRAPLRAALHAPHRGRARAPPAGARRRRRDRARPRLDHGDGGQPPGLHPPRRRFPLLRARFRPSLRAGGPGPRSAALRQPGGAHLAATLARRLRGLLDQLVTLDLERRAPRQRGLHGPARPPRARAGRRALPPALLPRELRRQRGGRGRLAAVAGLPARAGHRTSDRRRPPLPAPAQAAHRTPAAARRRSLRPRGEGARLARPRPGVAGLPRGPAALAHPARPARRDPALAQPAGRPRGRAGCR